MNSYAQPKQELRGRAVANTYSRSGPHSSEQSNLPPGPHAALQSSVNLRPQVRHVTQLQQMLNMSRRTEAPVQLKEAEPIQRNGWWDWITRSNRLPSLRTTPWLSGRPLFYPWAMAPAAPRSNAPSARNAQPQPRPSDVEFVAMRNYSFMNIPSGLRLAMGRDDERATAIAQQRLDAHRREPERHQVYHGHSNAAQATLHGLTHPVLAELQAKEKGITEREALADEELTAERMELLKNTSVVAMGAPQSPTDIPLTNLFTLTHNRDLVPQLPTETWLSGRPAVSNLQTLGTPFPPVPEIDTLADMDPDRIGANLMTTLLEGVRHHNYQRSYRQLGTETTRRLVESLRQSGPVGVNVGEGWGGRDVNTENVRRELYEEIMGRKSE